MVWREAGRLRLHEQLPLREIDSQT